MPSTRKRVAVRAAVVLMLAGAVAFALKPSGTPRAPGGRYACDAIWVGPRNGHWDIARNWSTGRVPAADERACVAPSHSVLLEHGDLRVGSLEIGGRLTITGATLRVTDRTRTSELGELVISHGVLAVGGRLDLAWRFYWGPGAHVAGPGMFVIDPASTSDLVGGDGATLPGGPATPLKAARGELRDPPRETPPPCGPYSPPLSEACGTRDKGAIKAVRAIWAQLAAIVDSTNRPDPAARLLHPGMCRRSDEPVPRTEPELLAGCRRLIAAMRGWTRANRPFDGRLDGVLVAGDRAYGGALPHGRIEFARTEAGWRITSITLHRKT